MGCPRYSGSLEVVISRGIGGQVGQGRAERAQPPPPFSKDTASLVVRSQVRLSAGVLRGQRHLKIAQDDRVRKPRQGDG